jgi:hypothetical protein
VDRQLVDHPPRGPPLLVDRHLVDRHLVDRQITTKFAVKISGLLFRKIYMYMQNANNCKKREKN